MSPLCRCYVDTASRLHARVPAAPRPAGPPAPPPRLARGGLSDRQSPRSWLVPLDGASVSASLPRSGDWLALPTECDEAALIARCSTSWPVRTRPLIDFAHVHRELARPGVTRDLLWREYRERGSGLAYTAFCNHYRRWLATQDWCCAKSISRATRCRYRRPCRSLRHRADTGLRRTTGLCQPCAASDVGSHVRRVGFGGAPRAIVPEFEERRHQGASV